ncbi:hypothetical protein QOZ84_02870 [Romboutsia sedimentorum]|uniref:Uncharacterized protein n=1 Tax=Romboutsia sedimentorum TaxID=1368474 RepID=A0ABT7E718_9FIRM|nr:hypothetical protein [Romboutsia sedimentorum]MDK2562477.1 hypothetical protein [Romboutsia sedimentorum]
MSTFLAPIHTWLFEKIKLAQDLEKEIVKLHHEKYKEEALKIQKEAVDIYGEYIKDQPLEDLIDVGNIHGWLQEQIKVVESRSAYIITKYYELYKEESKSITENAYISQAKKCANNESNKIDSPENVYISLNNYILSGMPCDRANSLTQRNDDCVVYEQQGCIHKANYELGKGNLQYLYELRDLWVKTFVESLAIKYFYQKVKNKDITINTIKRG